MAQDWYVLKIYSGHDKKIVPVVERELEIQGVRDLVEEIVVPTETVVEMKDGKKKEKTKVFFPGYILVKMELNVKTKHAVLNAPGIVSFVGPNNEPQALRPTEVNRILRRVSESEEESKSDKIKVPYKVGDPIRVVDGPFNDFKGYVEEINEEKMKVKVMVSIFGRSTPVELDFMQVVIEE
jgi:transcriptional antiterminator NusG